MNFGRNQVMAGLLWTAPWWLGFLFFLALPMAFSLYISFCEYPMLQPPMWIGAANYQNLTVDPVFHQTIFNTVMYAALIIPIGTIVAIGLAMLLNQRVRGQSFFRAAVFVPTVVPLVAAGLIWMWMLNPELGLVNRAVRPAGKALLPMTEAIGRLATSEAPTAAAPSARNEKPWTEKIEEFGRASAERTAEFGHALADGPQWLDWPNWAMAALVLVSLWFIGTPVVIYLAGLQEIPEELYEASTLDGASAVRRFWHITLPSLSPVILFNVITSIIAAWQVFALPFLMWRTRPGPDRATYFYTMYLFDNAFNYLKLGYASAMAWVQLLIILALTAMIFAVSRRMVHYRGS